MTDWTGKQLGQYHVLELIGQGGMASVYRAVQPSLGREVAIKVLTAASATDATFTARFEREVRIIAQLEHAHILPIYDYGQADSLSFLVMRYLDGGSLNTMIPVTAFKLAEVARLTQQIASALDYAHSRDVVHRDLKPHNVLLDKQGDAYLCDFGIAKLIGDKVSVTADGLAVGTPSYMAPEQWKAEKVDGRADIYALGVMLFELLAHQLPFHSDSIITLMYEHINQPPPSISALRPDISSAFDRIIYQALAKNPEDRFGTAGELAAAVEAAIHRVSSSSGQAYSRPSQIVISLDDDSPTDVVSLGDRPLASRAWILEDFEGWVQASEPGQQAFFLVGPHGLGKTQLARRFIERLGERCVFYELTRWQARSLDPRYFVQAVASQLERIISSRVTVTEPVDDPVQAFDKQVLASVSDETEPVYLLIDGLSEAFDHAAAVSIFDVLGETLSDWPESLRLIVTSAPDTRLDALFSAAHRVELLPDSDENRADVRETLLTRFNTLLPQLGSSNFDLLAMERKSEGNPLYFSTLLDCLSYKLLTVDDLADLPTGLDGLYADLVARLEHSRPRSTEILSVLAVAREPLSEQLLASIISISAPSVQGWLSDLRPLVRFADDHWMLSHRALLSWFEMNHTDDLVAAHRRIAESLTRVAPQQIESYALEHAPTHFIFAGQPEAARNLLTDLNFLEARLLRVASAAAINDFELLDDAAAQGSTSSDWHQTLAAIHDAMRKVSPDPDYAFTGLYSRLAGLASLQNALDGAIARRKLPWLRLRWPMPGDHSPSGTILWAGTPIHAVSVAGSTWLLACADRKMRLWQADAPLCEWDINESVTACALSPDSRIVVAGFATGKAMLYNGQTGEPVGILNKHRQTITDVKISPDGRYVLTASEDKLILLWDLKTTKLVQTFFEHPDAVQCCAFARLEGKLTALSGGADGVLRIWSLPDGRLLHKLKDHRGAVTVCAGLDSSHVLSGCTDHIIRIWSLQPESVTRTLNGHVGAVTAIGVHGNTIVSGAEDKTVRVWDTETGAAIARFTAHTAPIAGCAFLDDGRIVSTALDGHIMAFTAAGAPPVVESHGAQVTSCALQANLILTASLDRELRLWTADDGRCLKILRGHTGAVNACALRAGGLTALSASSDGTLRLWDTRSGEVIRLLTGHSGPVHACAFGPGDRVASGGEDRILRIWENGKSTMLLRGHKDAILACTFSPTDLVIASASKDRTLRLWSLQSQSVEHTLTDEHSPFTACAFSEDGSQIVAGTDHGRLIVFNLTSRATTTVEQSMGASIRACGFSSNARFVYAVSAAGACFWNTHNLTRVAAYWADPHLTCGALEGNLLALGDARGGVTAFQLERIGSRQRR